MSLNSTKYPTLTLTPLDTGWKDVISCCFRVFLLWQIEVISGVNESQSLWQFKSADDLQLSEIYSFQSEGCYYSHT